MALADSMGLVVGRSKAGPAGQWLERATDKVKVWAWETWIPSGPCPSSVEQSQRNHLASLSLRFLIISSRMIVIPASRSCDGEQM